MKKKIIITLLISLGIIISISTFFGLYTTEKRFPDDPTVSIVLGKKQKAEKSSSLLLKTQEEIFKALEKISDTKIPQENNWCEISGSYEEGEKIIYNPGWNKVLRFKYNFDTGTINKKSLDCGRTP